MIATDKKYSRFKDAPWFGKFPYIILGGAGGIGSWTALALSRVGADVYIYDFDRVEEHNMGGQLYRSSDKGLYKTEAINRTIQDYCSNSINTLGIYEEGSMTSEIMISAFDNMSARKLMFDAWVNSNEYDEKKKLFIDPRMSAETMQIYCLNSKERIDKYVKELFDDDAVPSEPCSFKSTSHTGMLIGSLITGIICNHVANISSEDDMREIPYKIEFEFPSLTFNCIS